MKLNRKAIIAISQIIIIIVAIIFIAVYPTKKKTAYVRNQGMAQGTYYSAIYLQPDGRDLQHEIDSFLNVINNSLSVYNPNSIISRVNRNDTTVILDDIFEQMFVASQRISEITHGTFDITVAPLISAWGFGADSQNNENQPNVDSLLELTGYQKVKLINHKIVKEHPSIMLNANAIAQGLTSDLVGKFLESFGCENYLFDIGGEIVSKGVNEKGEKWRIGIDKPIDDPSVANREIQAIMLVNDAALTTSGNYRKFYYRDGKKIGHTIDPRTGYPVLSDLLSVTVVAPTCTEADAFCTAFMVMGADSALAICKRIPELECYLLLTDSVEEYKIEMSENFHKYLK
jgi:Membrane-associated lipoprotein involved in thiamine biosynthesis